MQVSEKTVEISQLQAVEKTDEIRTDVGTQTSESSGAAIVEDTEASVSKTPDSIKAHDQASFKTTRNPSGESYPAFASEKSWNEASGKTMAHRQVPSNETVQKTVEVPQTRHIDKVADVPVARPRQTLSVQRVQKTVEVPQIQFIDKLVDSNMRSVPEVEHVVPAPVTEHMASAPAQSHADVSAGVKSDITWTKELAEIRQMIEFLVRRERKLDAKIDVRVRRLERLEKE